MTVMEMLMKEVIFQLKCAESMGIFSFDDEGNRIPIKTLAENFVPRFFSETKKQFPNANDFAVKNRISDGRIYKMFLKTELKKREHEIEVLKYLLEPKMSESIVLATMRKVGSIIE